MRQFISILAFVCITSMAIGQNKFVPFRLEQATEHWVIGTGEEAIKYSAYVGVMNRTDTCIVVELFTKKDIKFDEKTHIITNFGVNDLDFDNPDNSYVTSYFKESSVIEGGYHLVFSITDNFKEHWYCLEKSVAKGKPQVCNILNTLASIYIRQ